MPFRLLDFASAIWYNNGKEGLSKIEKVLVMLQITNKRELLELAKGDEDLENMAKIIDDLNEDPNIIGLYDKEEMDEWMKRIDRKEAIKTGRAEGLEQGLEQGLVQGSNQKAIEIARNMLEANMETLQISKLTGLSEEKVIKLKTEDN